MGCSSVSCAVSFVFLHRFTGAHELRQQYALSGRQPFSLHRLTGVRELRQRVRPLTGVRFSLSFSEGDSPRPVAGARGQTPAVSTLLTPVSLYFLVWRRPETGDRFENGERQSGYSCVCFVKYSQFTDTVLLHMPAALRNSFVW